jgi:hypothetical protein
LNESEMTFGVELPHYNQSYYSDGIFDDMQPSSENSFN